MNTTTLAPTSAPVTSGGPILVGIIIDVPIDYSAVLCLASPLHRIFILALAHQLTEKPRALGVVHSVCILCQVRDLRITRDIIHAELATLGYLPISHVGVLVVDGWQCLHGSADRVIDIERALENSVATLQTETFIREAHHRAALRAGTNRE